MNKKMVVTCILLISLSIVGCGTGQLFGPTKTPVPTITPTLKPITAADLSSAALKSTDLPSGFAALTGSDLQGMQDLNTVVTTDFPDAQLVHLGVNE